MRALPLLVVLILACLAPPNRLTGTEALPVLPPDQLDDWPAIGRLNKAHIATRGFCTGTLIAPDVVLTAAHCAPKQIDLRVSAPDKQRRVFVAGLLRDTHVANRTIIGGLRHPAYGVVRKHDPRYDLGLVFLESPITEITPMALASTPRDPSALALIGYHGRRPFALSGRFDCPLLNADIHIARIACPVVSGNSGGPVLVQNEQGGWEIVAVVSSTEPPNAIATRLTSWVLDNIDTHPARSSP